MPNLNFEWLEEFAEQEKNYRWGKEIKLLIKMYKQKEQENKQLKMLIENENHIPHID